ncbi:hypothetical protein GCM10028824_43960 [Hymenobacter segetis]|uniref:DUF4178 domain-containing protein n=1 Tax=Hymenobacter segetis TaxID=2025509 RepID=A0ABU9LTW0_9BACT
MLELLLVMVVSALLFSMAYAALRMVQRQQRAIERKSAALSQVSTWQTALAADFRAGTIVAVADDQVRCEREGRRVLYTFRDSVLVREQGEVIDTLPMTVRECTYYWQGQPRTSGFIDELAITAGTAARDTFYLQAAARYAAQEQVPSLPLTASPL